MSLGFVILVHTALPRAAQVVRFWAEAGASITVHVDKRVPKTDFSEFKRDLQRFPKVSLIERTACEWGSWEIVAATQTAVEDLISREKNLSRVFLASGSCLPLRPLDELLRYLNKKPDTDFIESVTTKDVEWTVGGLDQERFTLRFPFSWKKRRKLFDRYVELQRKVGFTRKIPEDVVPHLGSQWWCLTTSTLRAVLNDPRRAEFEAYFRKVWIPDESYFQSLVRRHSNCIESKSLTLSKFDLQGKPYHFYDDHIDLLKRSNCFVARKAWHKADKLYDEFLSEPRGRMNLSAPDPAQVERIFEQSLKRRSAGRQGLIMQSRFPNSEREIRKTANEYSVFQGFDQLFPDWRSWLSNNTSCPAHGHLFSNDRVEFEDDAEVVAGAISDSASLRDYNPECFLRNVIWARRAEHQCFQFGPDDKQDIFDFLASDKNANIWVISGAWAIPLFKSDLSVEEVRRKAAECQRIESKQLDKLTSPHTLANVRIWNLHQFFQAPAQHLQGILDQLRGPSELRISEAPTIENLNGFGEFLQKLKNAGFDPHLAGSFPTDH